MSLLGGYSLPSLPKFILSTKSAREHPRFFNTKALLLQPKIAYTSGIWLWPVLQKMRWKMSKVLHEYSLDEVAHCFVISLMWMENVHLPEELRNWLQAHRGSRCRTGEPKDLVIIPWPRQRTDHCYFLDRCFEVINPNIIINVSAHICHDTLFDSLHTGAYQDEFIEARLIVDYADPIANIRTLVVEAPTPKRLRQVFRQVITGQIQLT